MFDVSWSVTIDGTNYTERFNPVVEQIEVEDKAGTSSDTARITLDDRDGAIILPRKGARIAITIRGQKAFEGTTETPRSTGARGQARTLTIAAKGFDPEKGAKEGRHFHKDDATLKDYLADFGKKAGVTSVKVDPELGAIKRAWWGPAGRSFLHEGQRLADELGATFKIQGETAVFAKRGQGSTPGGAAMGSVTAQWGRNLISWDIEPYDAREVYRDVRVRRFDRKSAKYVDEKVDIEGGSGSSATALVTGTRADVDDAKSAAKGRKTKSERDKGGGSIVIDIEPRARAEGSCVLVGARPGIDGTYRIESATHSLARSGSTTKLTVKQPGDTAGRDGRKAAGAKPKA